MGLCQQGADGGLPDAWSEQEKTRARAHAILVSDQPTKSFLFFAFKNDIYSVFIPLSMHTARVIKIYTSVHNVVLLSLFFDLACMFLNMYVCLCLSNVCVCV